MTTVQRLLAISSVLGLFLIAGVPNYADAAATITTVTPTPGSTLAGSSEAFSWNSVPDAFAYAIWAGSTLGGNNYYNGHSIEAVSAVVTDLPTNGTSVHVRIWYKVPTPNTADRNCLITPDTTGTWCYESFSYTAITEVPGPDITTITPAPGATLTGPAQTFDWNDVPGASAYWFYVGNTAGSFDIFSSNAERLTSQETVANLPLDGRTLHITVWYKLPSTGGRTSCVVVRGNTWCSERFTYTAHTPNVPTPQCSDGIDNDGDGKIDFGTAASNDPGCTSATDSDEANIVIGPDITTITPAPGATLTGPAQTFDWNDVPGASAYWFYVGNTAGSFDIFSSNAERLTSQETVANLPLDGRTLHITVWYKLPSTGGRTSCVVVRGNTWCSERFTYTAHTPNVPTPQCSDGIDNDGDGKIDFGTAASNDPGCTSATDSDEANIVIGPDITTITPAPGATLTGPAQTFDWNDVPGASAYWFYVGNTAGSFDIFSSNAERLTSQETVANLPLDGRTLHITVWYKLPSTGGRTSCVVVRGNTWCSERFTYTAHTPNVPTPQCSDGIDNDGDGKIDFGTAASNDPGCTSATDSDESGPAQAGPIVSVPGTEIQAWIYPESRTCNAPNELSDGRKIAVLKMQYYHVVGGGALYLFDEASGECNSFSEENLARIKQFSQEQFVTVYSPDAVQTDLLLQDDERTSATVVELVRFVDDHNLTGVEIDFEDFHDWNQALYDRYKAFLVRLGNELHRHNKKLMVDGPAITSAGDEALLVWRYGDFTVLPVDEVVVLTYDNQFDRGAGSPVAPLAWIEDAVRWTVAKFPDTNRLTFGIPSYGYRGETGITGFTFFTLDEIRLEPGFERAVRDASSGEMTWVQDGTSYFFQDSTSMDLKRAAIERLGVHSLSVWHLGGNDWFTAE